ncbi:MAG: aminoacyl-tRNA hydrolase [Clostridia bacterium]|nr:aminoacyl-tRNA hydrolase [Clostridia bacterium]
MSIFDVFAKLDAEKKTSGPPEFIIVGLGNPGLKYNMTRHNAGFRAIDYVAKELGVSINKAKFESLYCDCTIDGKRCLLVKPETYMNNSGTAVQAIADFYKIEPGNILVLCDDISLDPGKIRIRRDGSHGGHNGLKNISQWLGTEKYPRIKIGVGKKPNPEYDLADWVLGKMDDGDDQLMTGRHADIFDAIKLVLAGDTEKAMSKYN